MTRPPVVLRIDRLVLEGVAPRDRAAVVAAFRTELARLLASAALPTAGMIGGGLSVAAPAPANAAAAGRAAAASVARAIGGGDR